MKRAITIIDGYKIDIECDSYATGGDNALLLYNKDELVAIIPRQYAVVIPKEIDDIIIEKK